eukprot:1151083-Prorocentrum_lima.AAC.1
MRNKQAHPDVGLVHEVKHHVSTSGGHQSAKSQVSGADHLLNPINFDGTDAAVTLLLQEDP